MIVVWLFALVLWVLFGLWGGKMATRSGLEYWIGFLVGFFGGIVGILVLWLVTRDRARENQRRMQYGQPPYPPAGYGPPSPNATANPLKVCPQCGKLVAGGARFCQYCGTALTMTVG